MMVGVLGCNGGNILVWIADLMDDVNEDVRLKLASVELLSEKDNWDRREVARGDISSSREEVVSSQLLCFSSMTTGKSG